MQQQLKAIIKQHDLPHQTRINIYNICLTSFQEINKKKNYVCSKSFFTSPANKFIQQLIHIHSEIINKLLKCWVKQHTAKTIQREQCQNISCFSAFTRNISSQQWKDQTKENILNILGQIINYFLSNQGYNKSKAQRQNIYLQIQCSLNYTCPVCLSKKDIIDIKSSNLIKDCIDEEQQKQDRPYPQTTKNISLQGKQRQIKLPLLTRPLQSIFEQMNQKRKALKLIEENRKNNSNKQWCLFGKLLDLNRQQFMNNTINIPKSGCQDDLLWDLQSKNVYNKDHINKFRRKLNLKGIKPIHYSNDQNSNFQNYHNPSSQSLNKKCKLKNNLISNIPKTSILLRSVARRQLSSELKKERQKYKKQQLQIPNKSMNTIQMARIDLGSIEYEKNKGNKLMDRIYTKNSRVQAYTNCIMKSNNFI